MRIEGQRKNGQKDVSVAKTSPPQRLHKIEPRENDWRGESALPKTAYLAHPSQRGPMRCSDFFPPTCRPKSNIAPRKRFAAPPSAITWSATPRALGADANLPPHAGPGGGSFTCQRRAASGGPAPSKRGDVSAREVPNRDQSVAFCEWRRLGPQSARCGHMCPQKWYHLSQENQKVPFKAPN